MLRPYNNDSISKNPIAAGDLHGFLLVSVKVLNRYKREYDGESI